MYKKLIAAALATLLLLAGCGEVTQPLPPEESSSASAQEREETREDNEWDDIVEEADLWESTAVEAGAAGPEPLRSSSKRAGRQAAAQDDSRQLTPAYGRSTPTETIHLFMQMCRTFDRELIELYFQEDAEYVIDFDDEEDRLMIGVFTNLFGQMEYSVLNENIYGDTAYVDLEIATFSMDDFFLDLMEVLMRDDFSYGDNAILEYLGTVDLSVYPRTTIDLTLLMEFKDGMWWLDDEDDVLTALMGGWEDLLW